MRFTDYVRLGSAARMESAIFRNRHAGMVRSAPFPAVGHSAPIPRMTSDAPDSDGRPDGRPARRPVTTGAMLEAAGPESEAACGLLPGLFTAAQRMLSQRKRTALRPLFDEWRLLYGAALGADTARTARSLAPLERAHGADYRTGARNLPLRAPHLHRPLRLPGARSARRERGRAGRPSCRPRGRRFLQALRH